MNLIEFTVEWPAPRIAKLRDRIAQAELPSAPAGAGWSLGCDTAFLERFRCHLLDGFNWQSAQQRLNSYPQFLSEMDGQSIHLLHVKGERKAARPLLMTHGWPGSHFEFWDVIDRLAFPSRFGGSADDAFDLIVPSLPGYGYSAAPAQPIGPRGTAALWDRLMTRVLGYPHYLAQGGDWGSLVTSQLGLHHGAVRGIHLNFLALRSNQPPRDQAEAAWAEKATGAQQTLSGYSAVQMMKPMSLGLASAGNPLGQAAWILERFHDWSDLSRRGFEEVFPLDHLAINALLYLMPDSFGTSLWFYNGMAREGGIFLPKGTRCEVPTGYANFPGDALMPPPPRSRVELCYNLVHWTDMPHGGHFAAMEQPGLFAADVIEWARKVWP